MTDATGPEKPTNRPLIVFKIGGSLLDLPDLKERISQTLALRPNCRPLLVAGGGAAAAVVREWDRIHSLGDDMAHELALQAMSLNEQFLERLFPRSRLVRSGRQFEQATADGVLPILCAHCFLKWGESAGHSALPRSWDVTSDSISAWIARIVHVEELVLLKSVPCPSGLSAADAAEDGLIDRYFAHLAPHVPEIGWINLRGPDLSIIPWLRAGEASQSR